MAFFSDGDSEEWDSTAVDDLEDSAARETTDFPFSFPVTSPSESEEVESSLVLASDPEEESNSDPESLEDPEVSEEPEEDVSSKEVGCSDESTSTVQRGVGG